MADRNPQRAIGVVDRVEMMCNFLETQAVRDAVAAAVPVTMPRAPGALGFDIPLWVGLGCVGLWAALDAFAERADLPKPRCNVCHRVICIRSRFASRCRDNEAMVFAELEDLRHLFAHNYAGETDTEYAARPRHVLVRGNAAELTCGAQFDGQRVHLDLPHLRAYAHAVREVLRRFP